MKRCQFQLERSYIPFFYEQLGYTREQAISENEFYGYTEQYEKVAFEIAIQIKLTDPISFGKAMLFDLSGKLVLTENFESNEFSMNVQSIPAGSYYLRVTDGQHQYFNHFVKK